MIPHIEGKKPDGAIVVLGAKQEEQSRDNWRWRLELDVAGRPVTHLFPLDSLEWRSAEYDIDPDDRETLLDIILGEPWLRDGIDLLHHPLGLFNAPTIGEARDFHLGRIGNVKNDHGLLSAEPKNRTLMRSTSTDPREFVKVASHFHPDMIAMKKELVGISRDRARGKAEKRAEMEKVQKASKLEVPSARGLLSVPQIDEPVAPDMSDHRILTMQKVMKGHRSYGNRNN